MINMKISWREAPWRDERDPNSSRATRKEMKVKYKKLRRQHE